MMRTLKWIGIILIALLIILQLIPKKLPENKDDSSTNIIYTEAISDEVAEILKVSCFDCHSNQIEYPWYSKLVPVYYLIKRDVELGREEVNFSEWGNLSKRKKIRVLSGTVEEVEDGDMPLKIHTIVHRDAMLTENEKQTLISWCENLSERLIGE